MAITEYNYIPTYIKRTINNKPKDVVTANYWNELFNLLITQGDHTAEELGNILNHFTAAITEVKGIADDKYVKPTNGIPKTDLAADVQTSLSKADTALQTHQSLAAYRTAFAQDVIDSGLGDRIEVIEGKEAGWDAKQDKLIAGDNITIAADGKTISAIGGSSASIVMRVNSGYIQYSTDNGNTWSNLIAEAALKGDKGDTGSQGLQGIQGPKGDKGDTGPKGEQGPSGVSPTISLEETASGVLIDIVDSDGSTSTAYVLHGKSAYDTAKAGGYTGTETEFAEKLAQEQLTGTTSTLTPTQVYNAVSAGIPVKVQYTDGTYGIISFTAFNVSESMNVIVSEMIAYSNGVYMLCELFGNKSNNSWGFNATTLAQKTDIPSALPNPNALTFTGAVTGSYDGSGAMTVNIPSAVTDAHINNLIDTKLGVIENGSY